MQEVANFNGIRLIDQWGDVSEELSEKVIALWQRNGALPPNTDPRDRVKQIVTVALDSEGTAVGVNTAYLGELPRTSKKSILTPCYYYRLFIQPDSRKPHLMTIMTTVAYEVIKAKRSADAPQAFAIITDNRGLTRPGMARLFKRHGCTPRMKLPDGRLILVKGF